MVIFLEPSIGQWSNNLCCHWYKKKEYTGETSCLVKEQIHTYRRHIRQQQYQQYAIKEKFHKFKSLLKKRLQNLLGSNWNLILKLDQLIKYYMRKPFMEIFCRKYVLKPSCRSFF